MLLPLIAFVTMLPSEDSLLTGFRDVPNDARMRMYWRVFGPAWQESEIDYQLDQAKSVGLGGLVAYFMYPVALDDPAKGIVNQRFGSPEFLRTFAYAAEGAKKRGLRFGVNGGTGWPYGGPTVTPQDAAKKLREVVVQEGEPLPKLEDGERVVQSWRPFIEGVPTFDYIESPTGQNVKRAAFGAEGLVLDHFNQAALHRWLTANVEPLLKGGNVETLGCDSLEVYSANWCSDLPVEFRKRRGYDILPLLTQLFNRKGAEGNALRFDYWRTLMELTEERFTKPLSEWSDRHHVQLEMEAYGTPPNPMTAYRYIHVPTGEHYEWRGFSVQKYVGSAAHVCGKNVVGSEAWTWAGLPNRLADTLSDIKLVSDMAFLAGCNDLTGVDYPYSPRSAGQPGWVPYYGPTMNENNPQWVAFPGLVQYLNRCQWMLRQGKPKVSIAVYLPVEDALATGGMDQMQLDFLVRDRFVTGKATSEFGLQNALKHRSALLQGIVSRGFDYDGIDLWAMNQIAKVTDSKLKAGTSEYKAIVLPFLETMDLSALQKVVEFCRRGGLVVAVRHLPRLPAGHRGDFPRFDRAVTELFGRTPVAGVPHRCGKGKAVLIATDDEVGPFLTASLTPQVKMSPVPETVGFCQRSLPDRDVFYFLNVDSKSCRLDVAFPSSRGPAQIWDAATGDRYRFDGSLDLPARGSVFVVVGPNLPAAQDSPALLTRELDWQPQWRIAFIGPDTPEPRDEKVLVSWTQWPGGRFFSGVGVYESELGWRGGSRAEIAFDEIHDGAKVTVNGKLAGYVFSPPYRLEIGPFLNAGRNQIKVEVGNLPVNRFIGLPDVDLKPLRAVYGARFSAPEEKQLMKEPAPSGIVGKVRIWTN